MRLDINLASQPYEDAPQFWLRWGTALAGGALLTLLLLTLTVTGWFAARRDRATISDLHQKIADRDALRANAEEFLNRPENRATRDESQFLNELIERKAFSWTRVLENLEKVMPPRVHLVSISPELDDDNQLALKMVVAGDSRDRAIELSRRMEESRRFAQTRIESEFDTPSPTGDTERIDMTAIYIPETPGAASASEAKTTDAAAATTPKAVPRAAGAGASAGRKSAPAPSASAPPAPGPTAPGPTAPGPRRKP